MHLTDTPSVRQHSASDRLPDERAMAVKLRYPGSPGDGFADEVEVRVHGRDVPHRRREVRVAHRAGDRRRGDAGGCTHVPKSVAEGVEGEGDAVAAHRLIDLRLQVVAAVRLWSAGDDVRAGD